jgi:hypothetical protein
VGLFFSPVTMRGSRDNSLEINAKKEKCIIMSPHPNSGQNQNIRIFKESFENVAEFKYWGRSLQIRLKFMECLLLFSPHFFVFPCHIINLKIKI